MKKRILIVDDLPTIREPYQLILAKHFEGVDDLEVISAESPEDAQDKLGNLVAIVTDIEMPDASDGLGLIEQVHQQDDKIFIIAMSSDGGYESFAIKAGANTFLSKPFKIDELTKLLESNI